MFNKLRFNHVDFNRILVTKSISITFILFTSYNEETKMQTVIAHAFRLKPGQFLQEEIQKYVVANKVRAGWMSTCVRSLTQFNLRLANQPTNEKRIGHFEIVILTGTVFVNGSHLHLAISDNTGKTIGSIW